MNIFRRIAANTVWLFAAHVAHRFSNLVVTLLLTRYLGAEGFGAYSFVCAYVGFFVLLTDMGIDMWITREASRDLRASEQIVGNAIVLKAILSGSAFGLSVGASMLIGIPSDKIVLIAIASLGLLLAPLTLYAAAFSATLQLHLPAGFEILGRVLLVSLVGAAIILRGSLTIIFIALVLPGACTALLNLVYARRLFRPYLVFQWRKAQEILSNAVPIALIMVFTQLLLRIDQLMLEWMRGDHELGLYAVAVKCCEALNVVPIVFIGSMFPIMSKTASYSTESLTKVYHLSFRYLSLVLAPLIMLLFLYPEEVLRILFGEGYAGGAPPLRILAWSGLFVAMGYVVTTASISLGSQRALISITAVLAVLNIVLNLFLIPRGDAIGGARGAALATLVSYAASFLCIVAVPRLRPFGVAFLESLLKPVLALVPAVILVRAPSLGPAAGLPAVLAIYGASVVAFKGLDASDYRYLRSIFKRP